MRVGAALWIGGLGLMAGTQPALAHPQVFIDAGIEVIFDAAGLATGIRVTWAHDAFCRLMIAEERKLDPDGDGRLDGAETASLAGFDVDWAPDYPRDTYAFLDDVPLRLSRPSEFAADVVDCKIISSHIG